MKSGWQMEWEFEMQYAAPMRSYLATFVATTARFQSAMVQLSVSFEKATRQLREIAKALNGS